MSTIGGRYEEQQQVPIHTEYIQIDQLLKLEGIIETGGQIKSFIDEGILTLNGQVVTEKRKEMSRWGRDFLRRSRCRSRNYSRGGIIGEN